jgi:pimeloyl-ACP methyl ester carboxylesterase
MTPIVLVHGNPETTAVWDHLLPDLARVAAEPLLLSPPGFGAPMPDGFAATPIGYRDWLIGQLEGLDQPVHLIGHDWGGGFALLTVMHRPDLVRSWASDAVGLFHPDYVWHDLAQMWQSTPAGEDWVAQMLETPSEQWADALVSYGMAAPIATEIAPAFNDAMGRCILELYRASVQPVLADLGKGVSAAAGRPGLGIVAHADQDVGTLAQRREVIASSNAQAVELPGRGHWWMTDGDQSAVTNALTELWARA